MNDNEPKIEVSGGQIICKQVIPDGKYKLVVEVSTTTEETTCHQREGIFKLVPASRLSLKDDFLKYQPKTEREQEFKELVETAIKNGLKDFWRPVCDPSFDDNGRICYEPGKKPALGECQDWWEENAQKYAPECGSRLGTRLEYVAFLAVLIKELVVAGKSVKWAWNAVCNNSTELGHYCNSENAKHIFEETGSREVCGFFDLANTYKILAEDEERDGYWFACGTYHDHSYEYQLARVMFDELCLYDHFFGCGWIVFDSCPKC